MRRHHQGTLELFRPCVLSVRLRSRHSIPPRCLAEGLPSPIVRRRTWNVRLSSSGYYSGGAAVQPFRIRCWVLGHDVLVLLLGPWRSLPRGYSHSDSGFQEAIRVVPQLAPLFARMSTHVVEQRFTATEALSFFDMNLTRLPEQIEASPVVLEPGFEVLRDPDLYWSILSANDRLVWREYRVPPRSWIQRLLTWFARNRTAWKLLRSVRRFLYI